jgi:hypothetical protein
MKILVGAIIGSTLASGIFVVRERLFPKLPEVLASSISPDSKWICEIVDIDPRGPVCEILIHGQAYAGSSKLERGYRGQCVVMDLDSESISHDVKFEWNGPEVTIQGYPIHAPVRLLCGAEGEVIVRDAKAPNPQK